MQKPFAVGAVEGLILGRWARNEKQAFAVKTL
jgi:hypothetical protein